MLYTVLNPVRMKYLGQLIDVSLHKSQMSFNWLTTLCWSSDVIWTPKSTNNPSNNLLKGMKIMAANNSNTNYKLFLVLTPRRLVLTPVENVLQIFALDTKLKLTLVLV